MKLSLCSSCCFKLTPLAQDQSKCSLSTLQGELDGMVEAATHELRSRLSAKTGEVTAKESELLTMRQELLNARQHAKVRSCD